MSSFSKSSALSVSLHAALLAVLYLLPASESRRFQSSGQLQVITLELSQAVESAKIQPVSVEVPPPPRRFAPEQESPREEMLEPFDREIPPAEPLGKRPTTRPDAPTSPPVATAVTKSEPPKRRQLPEQLPDQPIEEVVPRRPPVVRTPPPSFRPTNPMEQIAGLQDPTSADLSSNPPPEYPAEAVRRRLEGTILLELTIDASGNVTDATVLRSSGHASLDRAAIDAVLRWKGQPATRWGRPVATVERLPVRFRL
ncbi:energy transducer TonB [Roseiconus nitratireducens]|uniref:Energy transducer TonB n=1 Tax=Roseiconus nitratireducens TaxID=2605748 RepID=A0A5M6CWF5_9BACT|nr:energy transducer TonB [Roseiconus nitratireducens]KAA5539423.1 energy transducer TonB [Roseiconus nitratireducens]